MTRNFSQVARRASLGPALVLACMSLSSSLMASLLDWTDLAASIAKFIAPNSRFRTDGMSCLRSTTRSWTCELPDPAVSCFPHARWNSHCSEQFPPSNLLRVHPHKCQLKYLAGLCVHSKHPMRMIYIGSWQSHVCSCIWIACLKQCLYIIWSLLFFVQRNIPCASCSQSQSFDGATKVVQRPRWPNTESSFHVLPNNPFLGATNC